MANVQVPYSDVGKALFQKMDNWLQSFMLAGEDPELFSYPFTSEASQTFALGAVVGLNAANRLVPATTGLAAKATRTLGTTNAALTITAANAGVGGNAITVALVAPTSGGSVAITGTAIVVSPVTGTDSAAAVAAQINAYGPASNLVVASFGGTGASSVVPVAATALAGGVSDVHAIGVMTQALTTVGGEVTTTVPVWISGCFNGNALVYDASFSTPALQQNAFMGAPSPTQITIKFRPTGAPGT